MTIRTKFPGYLALGMSGLLYAFLVTEDWKGMILKLQALEDMIPDDLDKIADATFVQRMEDLSSDMKKSLGIMRPFLSVVEEQLTISKELLMIQTVYKLFQEICTLC